MALQRVILFDLNLLLLIFLLHNCRAYKSIYNIDSSTEADACENNICQADFGSVLTTTLDLVGTKEYQKDADGNILNFSSKINVTQTKPSCPALTETEGLSQKQLLELLTAACRYDRFMQPKATVNGTITDGPLNVFIRLDISVADSGSSSTQLEAEGILQLRYVDPRLAYAQISPERKSITILEEDIRKVIWVPRFFFTSVGQTLPLTQSQKVVITNISPEGSVDIILHLTTNLNCKMQLQKFPFDEQYCTMLIESWLYNSSDVIIQWESYKPLLVDPGAGLMEFVLEYKWSNDTVLVSNVENIVPTQTKHLYAALNFTIYLRRQSGYYIMQYFLPSMMIVAISWVSFWLQADQTPARTTLGTTTLLSFITLGSSIEKNIPKVNYIKISEIWFFACIAFIFFSLVEFAFVNTIWRRKNNVAMKRISSRHILKKTLTPQNNRQISAKLRKIKCVSSVLTIPEGERFSYISNNPDSPYPTGSTDHMDNPFTFNIDDNLNTSNNSNNKIDASDAELNKNQSLSSMTPHEVSLWIDRKARFAFPLAFIIFNAAFWTFAMLLQ